MSDDDDSKPKKSLPLAACAWAIRLSVAASDGSDVGKVRQVRPDGRHTWQYNLPAFCFIPGGSFVFIGRIY